MTRATKRSSQSSELGFDGNILQKVNGTMVESVILAEWLVRGTDIWDFKSESVGQTHNQTAVSRPFFVANCFCSDMFVPLRKGAPQEVSSSRPVAPPAGTASRVGAKARWQYRVGLGFTMIHPFPA